MSGTFAAGIGPTFGAVGANGLLGEFGRAAAHATANLILGSFSGKNPTLGNFATGFFSSLTGSMAHQLPIGAQIGISSLTGGIIADLGGDEFWKGAATGAIVSTVNHGAHGIQEKIGEHKFFKRLRLHYENNNGQDFFITTDEFKYLIKHGNVNYSTAKQIGDGYFSAEIDFYKSKLDLALSFGRARIYLSLIHI